MLSEKSIKRIHREIKQFEDDKPDFISKLIINENNLKNILFVLDGPPNTPYEGGEYIIEMILSDTYPHDPPNIKMKTPNGRFAINQNICTTFTSYHPESWSPVYTFSTIIKSFISFMLDNDTKHVGSYSSTIEEKKAFAQASKEYNKKILNKKN